MSESLGVIIFIDRKEAKVFHLSDQEENPGTRHFDVPFKS